MEKHEHRSEGESYRSAHGGMLSPSTDASAGRLLDVMILKELKSLASCNWTDVLAKLNLIEDHLSTEHKANAETAARIETTLAGLIELLQSELVAQAREMANELRASRRELSASVRAHTNPTTETKT